jgi:hypothetical protein
LGSVRRTLLGESYELARSQENQANSFALVRFYPAISTVVDGTGDLRTDAAS